MNSIGPECNDLKKEYDACFNVWYSESFLKGQYKADPCSELLKSYRSCVLKAIKERNIDLSDIEANIIGTEKEKQPPPEKQLVKTHDMCLLTQSRNSGIAEMQSNSEQKNPSQLVNEIETFKLSQE